MRFLIQTTTDIPYGVNKTIAKECALIAVDEMISVLTDLNGIYNITPALTYWQDVKKEIEAL